MSTAGHDGDRDAVVWHDLECGAYAADLPLWRELAAAEAGPILDIGAGTGRVAIDLALRGHEVVAVDSDPQLLAALDERAAGLRLSTVVGDGRELALGERSFGLVIVPMQTIQLLDGATERGRLLDAVRRRLTPGGLFAAAVVEALGVFEEGSATPPLPDVREVGGRVYTSRPVAMRDEGACVAIERVRDLIDAGGASTSSRDVVRLNRLDAAELADEATVHGLAPVAPRPIAATADHVASVVVMARG